MDINNLDAAVGNHILVIGDVMLDRYTLGEVNRMSPEAPVPILSKQSSFDKLGGAANAALNLKSLGFKVSLCGVIGNDDPGMVLSRMLKEEGVAFYPIVDFDRDTTVKHRIIAEGKQLLRIDQESTEPLPPLEAQRLLDSISKLKDLHGVVISDYDKGCLTKEIIQESLALFHSSEVPVYVDPKYSNFWDYKNVRIFKPNKVEIEAATKEVLDIKTLKLLSEAYERLKPKYLICTLAGEGISYTDGLNKGQAKTKPITVIDVSGAGDTAMAAMVLGDQCALSMEDICTLANAAGRIVCQKLGIVSVGLEELKTEVSGLKDDI